MPTSLNSYDDSPRVSPKQAALYSNGGCLSPLRSRFRKCFTGGFDGMVTADDVARRWATAAEEKAGRALQPDEQLLVAASVHRSFHEMDLDRDGCVGVDDWTHRALLEAHPPGPVVHEAISESLYRRDPGLVSTFLQMWEAGSHGSGLLSCEGLGKILGLAWPDSVEEMLGRTTDRAPPTTAEVLFAAMDISGNGAVSYAEFCAYLLGLRFRPVLLYYYDLSKCMAKHLGPVLFGKTEEGIWHSSLVVYGREYCYHGVVQARDPGTTSFGTPTKSLTLGLTLRSKVELESMIRRQWNNDFQPETYDAFENNCNSFCDRAALFLLGRHIPDEVRLLSVRLYQSPLARMLRPLLNGWLSKRRSCSSRFGFSKADTVFWCSSDEDVPIGCKGQVTGFTRERVRVRFPTGTWGFKPSELRRACAEDESEEEEEDDETSSDETRQRSNSIHLLEEEESSSYVLFEAPGSIEPVVARVLRQDSKGTSEVIWFAEDGRRRVSAGVRRCDLRPYELPCKDDPTSSREFLSALEAVVGSATLEDKTIGTPRAFGHDMSLDRTDAHSPTKCPSRHRLRASRISAMRGLLRSQDCDLCGRKIPRADVRMCCKLCRWNVCAWCWEKRRPYDMGCMVGALARCPHNHRMERLTGQAVRLGACCKICGQAELGSTGAYFFCCQPCSYDLCPKCAEISVQEKALEANLPVPL